MKKVVLLDNSNSWEAAGDLQRGAAFSQRDMAAEDLSGTSRVPGSLQQRRKLVVSMKCGPI